MLRSEVLQPIVDLYERPNYLEIGVENCGTFNAVSAARKIAVDIEFSCDLEAQRAAVTGQDVHFHECPSDDYFARIVGDEKFNVIFIDGLHTFDQTLRDLLNAMAHLREGGVIVIDDVIPPSYAASLPSLAECNAFREERGIKAPDWMGDVYRLVVFLRDYLPAYSFATVAENHGQAVVWRQTRALDDAQRSIEEVCRMTYAECITNRPLFNVKPFAEIMELLRARPGAGA